MSKQPKPFTPPKPRLTKKEFISLKPSELLSLALQDLKWAERSPRMSPFMSNWARLDSQICYACLAGCTLVRSLGLEPNNAGSLPLLVDFDFQLERRAQALDSFRCGAVAQGLAQVLSYKAQLRYKKRIESLPSTIPITPYETDRKAFKADLAKLADLLHSVNL